MVANFLILLNLQICKYWYFLCCVEQTETHASQSTENLYKSQNH